MKDPPEDHNVCPSCGTEFGLDDSNYTHFELRRMWWMFGLKWQSRTEPQPNDWDALQQMLDAGLL